jgi:hypothetical protein
VFTFPLHQNKPRQSMYGRRKAGGSAMAGPTHTFVPADRSFMHALTSHARDGPAGKKSR